MKFTIKISALLISALVTISINSNSYGFTLRDAFWFEGQTVFRVNLPDGTERQSLFSNAFRDALNEWSQKSSFIYEIDENPTPANPCPNNGFNSIAFATDVCGDEFGSGTLAVTLSFSRGEQLTRTIIIFNETQDWEVYDRPRLNDSEAFDFRRVAIHELGHAMGLNHSTSNNAIMFPFFSDVNSPQADDIAGAAARYDADSDSIALASDNCPNRANLSQKDIDQDNIGDRCDVDADSDGVFNDTGIDQSYEVNNLFNTNIFNDDRGFRFLPFGADHSLIQSLAQTFETPFALTLNAVRLPIGRCDSGTLTVQIRTLDNNNPGVDETSILQETVIDISDSSPLVLENDLLTINFTPRNYPAGQRLAIVAQHSASNCTWLLSQTEPSPIYSAGSARILLATNSSWLSLENVGSDGDIPFETIITPASFDNCPSVFNNDQADTDGDGIGDACEGIAGDSDGDSIIDEIDNCPSVPNIAQLDDDNNNIGNLCEKLDTQEVPICAPIKTKNNKFIMICF